MAIGKISRTVSTKTDKDGDGKNTVFTVDFTGCSDDVLKSMAYNYLTVKRQGSWRRKGIPAKEEIQAANFAPGSRSAEPVNVESVAARASTLSAEERKALLARLQAEFADSTESESESESE